MQIARREPAPELRAFLNQPLEGWEQRDGALGTLREVPIPGIPLIISIDSSWSVEGPKEQQSLTSFVAGLHAAPAFVRPAGRSWTCIELRLDPVGAHRILGRPMHDLVNRSVALEDLFPESPELEERLAEAGSWAERFDLVELFLRRRLAAASAATSEVEWSWQELRRTSGRAPIADIAQELGWSHRRLIARFREQVGLAPKAVARIMRFDRAARALRSPTGPGLAEIAFECGYFDQAHLNRDFRALAGTTPAAFRAATLPSGGVAA